MQPASRVFLDHKKRAFGMAGFLFATWFGRVIEFSLRLIGGQIFCGDALHAAFFGLVGLSGLRTRSLCLLSSRLFRKTSARSMTLAGRLGFDSEDFISCPPDFIFCSINPIRPER